ncbi:hypothetical protein OIDMADRAFT_147668 [Oidiodendron maius Zn]|uniref:F-box domain-containing protein n=1 Tax=Oidiodendron maius (strain Zn) TaxID=913774 RepID=A0A0C3H3F1_OIDMZ|nr:hypothetical protein OIDMADRAFT_147668 [Oidiodendron maius Zn]
MARKDRSRRVDILQDSPFLNLPAEIREQIYYAALVRPTPIDLWPMEYAQDPITNQILRLQEDLAFVRKEMATGLLTTCKQIFQEASNIFWSKNTFRFSGDIEWFGARRFLGQVGPRALSQLQSLELFAPLADAHCLDTSSFDGSLYPKRIEFYSNAREAKNRPKMHMVKARKGPWMERFPARHIHRRRLDAHTNFVLTRNVEHVCHLLDVAKASVELKLILPRGFGLNRVDGPVFEEENQPGWTFRARFRNVESYDLLLPQGLLRILPLFTRSAKLVVEAGAQIKDLEMVERFTNRGISVLCQPGSFIRYDMLEEVLVAKQWMSLSAEFDFLDGTSALFDEIQRDLVPALGGRATSTSGPISTMRILKGFGGCRFVERDEWNCVGCPFKRGKLGLGTSGRYLHRPTSTKCSVNKVLVIKNKSRAIRNGFVNSGVMGDR